MSIGVSVREARNLYYKANGISSDGGDSEKISKAKFGPVTLYLLNFDARRAAIRRHDIHHLIVGEDTSLKGEAIVGAWEVGGGIWPYWVASFFEPQAMSWGLILAPKETFRWFVRGRRSKNLYKTGLSENILDLTVKEVRTKYLPNERVDADLKDYLLFLLWSLFGLLLLLFSISVILTPIVLLFLAVKSLLY